VGAEFREFQQSEENEDVVSAGVTLSRQLSRRMTARLRGGWRSSKFRDGRDDDFWDVELTLARRLGPDVNLDLALAHQRQDSTSAVDEFTETSASARLQVNF